MNRFNENESYGIILYHSSVRETIGNYEIKLEKGTLFRILNYENQKYRIELQLCIRKKLSWSDHKYVCERKQMKLIDEKLFQILIAIPEIPHRSLIGCNESHSKFVLNLTIGTVVNVNGIIFDRVSSVVCCVKYIGEVPEIGPGIYFGFKLFDKHDTIPKNTSLPLYYFHQMDCNIRNGFIRHAGCLFTRTKLVPQNAIQSFNEIQRKSIQFEPCNPTAPTQNPPTYEEVILRKNQSSSTSYSSKIRPHGAQEYNNGFTVMFPPNTNPANCNVYIGRGKSQACCYIL